MAYSYKTNISFALVYIPVKLHLAVRPVAIGFNMLDKKTMSRIKYLKTCEACGGREVDNKDIIKGYKYDDDNYVIFEKDELEKLKTEKDKSITIDSFIDLKEVDALYFEKSYYVEPTGAEKAYLLLLNTLKKENKAGLAKCVLGSKESVVLLMVKGDILILSTLHFQDDIKTVPFKIKQQTLTKKETDMAQAIVKSMSEKFNIEEYKDEYTNRLKKAISDKIAGREIKQADTSGNNQARIVDLMSALESSLNMLDKKIVKKTDKPVKSAIKKTAATQVKPEKKRVSSD